MTDDAVTGTTPPLTRGGPARLAVVDRPGPVGASTVLLLHATLATVGSLMPLAKALAADARVLAVDRRGSGRTAIEIGGPVLVATHVGDVVHALDEAAVDRVTVVGHSFGGVVGIELAARHPDRVAAVLAWEPPYLAVADEPLRARFRDLAHQVIAAHASGGRSAAAACFYDAVTGDGAWDALPRSVRAAIAAQGDGVLADVAMPDLDPSGLHRIGVPTVLATGGASDPMYAPIVDALVARIRTARRVDLPGLTHGAPITEPLAIAGLVRDLLRAVDARTPASDQAQREPSR